VGNHVTEVHNLSFLLIFTSGVSVSFFLAIHHLLFSLSLSLYHLSQLHDFWRLDYWEDDLRRRRRFVRNAFGSTHPDVALKSLEEYGQPQHILNPQFNLQCPNMSLLL